MKLLTVTIPAYNAEMTLGSTLDSLCLADRLADLEILVVDDGSSDGTASIAKGYADRYPETVHLISKENGGHGSAVNAGIIAAAGRYFKVVDADDTLDPAGYRRLLERLEATGADLLLAHYQRVSFTDPDNVRPMRFDGVEYGRKYEFDQLPAGVNIYFGIHSMTIRTSILKEHDIRLQEHTFYVDAEYGLLPVPFIRTVEFLDAIVYQYYVGNPGQSVSSQNFVKRYADHDRVVRRLVKFVSDCGAQGAKLNYIYATLEKLCFTNYMLAVFYDEDTTRGKARAREFDEWLKSSNVRLYGALGNSRYIRLLRLIHFAYLPKGTLLKNAVRGIYSRVKPIFRKKRRFTY